MKDDAKKLAAKEARVIKAAEAFWLLKKPVAWSLAQYLLSPLTNNAQDGPGAEFAEAVADLVSARRSREKAQAASLKKLQNRRVKPALGNK